MILLATLVFVVASVASAEEGAWQTVTSQHTPINFANSQLEIKTEFNSDSQLDFFVKFFGDGGAELQGFKLYTGLGFIEPSVWHVVDCDGFKGEVDDIDFSVTEQIFTIRKHDHKLSVQYNGNDLVKDFTLGSDSDKECSGEDDSWRTVWKEEISSFMIDVKNYDGSEGDVKEYRIVNIEVDEGETEDEHERYSGVGGPLLRLDVWVLLLSASLPFWGF